MASGLLIGGLARGSPIDAIYFDPAGHGASTVNFASWDWDVGNTLQAHALPASTTGHDFVEYYQARLANFKDATGQVITGTGLNTSYEITIVAGYTLTGTRIANTTNYTMDERHLAASQQVNSLTVYLDTNLNSNDLAGSGFGDGIPIMSGTVSSATGILTTYKTSYRPASNLDQFGGNDWAGTSTAQSTGSIDLQLSVPNVNASYLTNSGPPLDAAALGGQMVTPYLQTDPARQWTIPGPYTPAVGTTNGVSGPDVLLQTDSNMSFSSAPEPAALGLLAMAGGLAILRRRRPS